jgi:hypothetical protein
MISRLSTVSQAKSAISAGDGVFLVKCSDLSGLNGITPREMSGSEGAIFLRIGDVSHG